MTNGPLTCKYLGCFQKFHISASDFGTMSMCKQFRACAYEFLTMVSEGVVHYVHKAMIRFSFSLIWRHKVSEGSGRFKQLPKVS